MKMIRSNFPWFQHTATAYLDSAATTHKPQAVIDAINNFYAKDYAPVHRSIYKGSELATAQFEQVRSDVARFINAQESSEIIFTKGATEGINLIAATWGQKHLKAGDEILLTHMEHHANLLPWQELARRTGTVIKYIPLTNYGTLDLMQLPTLLTQKTKLVAVVHVSHVFGTYNDVVTITKHAHAVGARVLIDACQSAAHVPLDMQEMGADFLVFSGHKLFGPTGIGILYIKKELHESVPPYQLGGGMVYSADYEQPATWRPMPAKLEAGTPPIAQVIGLGAAIAYLEGLDRTAIKTYEASLVTRLIEGLEAIPGIDILGPREYLKKEGHLVTFTLKGYHPHDLAAYLDTQGIAVRAGDLCAQPLFKRLGLSGAIRASFGPYTALDEVDALVEALKKLC